MAGGAAAAATDATTAPDDRDRGSTFVEVVVTIALMGITMGTIIAGMHAAIRASRLSDERAKVEVVLGSAADRLAGWTYVACPEPDGPKSYLPPVQAAIGAAGWDDTSRVRITEILYWQVPDGAPPTAGSWGPDCNPDANLTTSRTLQRITIEVRSPGDAIVRSLQVVKHNVVPKEVLAPDA